MALFDDTEPQDSGLPATEDDTWRLVGRLLAGGGESECVEFKHDNDNPEEVGEYISALATSAAIHA
jgi:hypothetical protein